MAEHLIALLRSNDLDEHIVRWISRIHDDAAVAEHLIAGVLHAHRALVGAPIIRVRNRGCRGVECNQNRAGG